LPLETVVLEHRGRGIVLGSTYSKWTVLDIHGVIDISWTLKITALLQNEAKRIEMAAAGSHDKTK